MKEKWLKKILVIVSYLVVGLISLSIAVFLSSRFLLPLLAQEKQPQAPAAQQEPKKEEPAQKTNAAGTVPAAKTLSPVKAQELPAEGGEAKAPEDMTIDDLNHFLRVYEYDPGGRRDPFQPFVQAPKEENLNKAPVADEELTPLERFDLDQIELLGIIWQVSKPKVMLKDPTGRVHIVGKNAKIGRNHGYIAVIREGEVVIVESFEDEGQVTYQTRIKKLSK